MTVEEEAVDGTKPPALRPWVTALSLVARLVLAGIWIVSGATKIGDHLQTVVAVKAYAVVPEAMVEPIAYMLPILEILLGVFLLLGIKNRWMAIASALVFTLFIIMIIQAWVRGFQIDCGCFGGGGYDPTANTITYLTEIARDLIFMVFAVWLACFPKTPLALDPSSRAAITMRKRDN